MRIWLCAVLFACSGPTNEPAIVPSGPPLLDTCLDEPSGGTMNGVCELGDRVGGFIVEDQEEFTVVSGSVKDAVLPLDVLQVAQAAGDCVLLERELLFCEPGCPSGETCNGTECVPFPTSRDVGTTFLSGFETCVQMEPTPPGNNYFFNGLTESSVVPGAVVQLNNNDLELSALGVDRLVPSDPEWVLVSGEAATLRWVAGSVPEAEIAITVSIDQHGASPLRLECTFEDDGEGVVPGLILERLINSGVSGFPTGRIQRRTADSDGTSDGCVDFVVSSARQQAVDVSGFTPCNRTEECPDPQVCDVPNQICVDPS